MNLDGRLKGRSLLTLDELSDEEMLYLVGLAMELKTRRRRGERGDLLHRKNIALIFEKSSTRTRCAAAVAASDEGAHTDYLSAREIHLGKKESVADTARVLGRMYDGILFRGYAHETVRQLAEYSGIPVWNGLTDESHPTQALADLQTIRESFGRLKGLRVTYVGDGRNNVANSLMLGCVKAGMNFVNCAPPSLMPAPALVSTAERIARANGCRVDLMNDPLVAVRGANVVYTDVWVSMGEEDKHDERVRLLSPYQITMDLMRATGNLERGEAIFLHCLPAFHDSRTEVTAESGALEVTDEVFEAPFSRVFDEAENRMHSMKALFVSSLSEHRHA